MRFEFGNFVLLVAVLEKQPRGAVLSPDLTRQLVIHTKLLT
jgi:hypothetical protein